MDNLELTKSEKAIEAILFAAGEAVDISKIANAIEVDVKLACDILNNLMDKYYIDKRGIQIIRVNDSFQMCTNTEYFESLKKVFQISNKNILTQSLIETLAIIAYKQPITKGQIEEIRGVDAGHAVNKLVEFNLVVEKGRLDSPGKPILFGTSDEFLKYYGFNTLEQLPVVEADINILKEEAEKEINNIQGI